MIRSVATARQKYKESLEEERKRKKEEDLTKEKKKVTDEVTVLVQRREKFQKLHENLDAEFVSLMKQAEDKNGMTMVVKGNALKRRSEQALEDTKVDDESIELLKEKQQKMH